MQHIEQADENEEFIDQAEIEEELEIGERPEEEDEDMEGIEDQGFEAEDEANQHIEFHDDSIQGFFEHKEPVFSVAVHPTNSILAATGGSDDKSYLWSIESGEKIADLAVHADSCSAVAFSNDGKYVASGGMDGKLFIFNMENIQLICTLEGPSEINWIQWHPRGHVIVAASEDGTIWMWNIPLGTCMNVFTGHADSITSGQWTPDGKMLVTGSTDGSIICWDPKTGSALHKWSRDDGRFHQAPVTALCVSNDNSMIVSGDQDGKTLLLQISSKRIIGELEPHHDSVETIQFSPTTHFLATGGVDGKIHIWDTSINKLRFTVEHQDAVTKLRWSADGKALISASIDGSIIIWDARAGNSIRILKGHQAGILDFDIRSDGTVLVTGSDDGTSLPRMIFSSKFLWAHLYCKNNSRMGWEDDILGAIAPSGGVGNKTKRKRGKRPSSSDDEGSDYKNNSDLEPIDSDEDDPEFAEISSWNKNDLMGDKEDRKRLFAMSEFERERELAERREKLDAYEERITLKKRLKYQTQRMQDAASEKLTDRQKKGQSLENLRKKREKKAKARSRAFSEDSPNAKSKKKRSAYETESDISNEYDYDENDEEEKTKASIAYQDALSIQLTRDKAENWLYKPDFERTIKGCLARISLGNIGSGTREPVYRCVYIADVNEYHRKYKLNKTWTKTSILVSHGKAKKQYLMDMLSNQPITMKEWSRYETVHTVEKLNLPSMNHVKRKVEELSKIEAHVFTESEFNEMLLKKKELKQAVVNVAFEKIRLETMLEAARQEGDFDKVQDIKLNLADLDELAEAEKQAIAANDSIAKMNAKSREINRNEIQEAEKAALALKRSQGVNESDPFARRKTAPMHVVNNSPSRKKEDIVDPEISKSISQSASTLEDQPLLSDIDDEDPFANIDVSILEEDLKLNS